MSTDSFFDKIDYLVVPSLWHEPMGRVVIEAYAYGVPVLVNKVGGLVELIEDGKTGVVSHVEDAKQFSEDLKRLISLDYQKISMSCILASKSYTDELMVEKYIDIYTEEQ
jgi:glycosyltransferase involved in cell wall biosynthesis